MKIYLELTPEQYKTMRTAVENYQVPQACPVCKSEYGNDVVRVVGGHVVRAWQGIGPSPSQLQLSNILMEGDKQLEVAEYEG